MNKLSQRSLDGSNSRLEHTIEREKSLRNLDPVIVFVEKSIQ